MLALSQTLHQLQAVQATSLLMRMVCCAPWHTMHRRLVQVESEALDSSDSDPSEAGDEGAHDQALHSFERKARQLDKARWAALLALSTCVPPVCGTLARRPPSCAFDAR